MHCVKFFKACVNAVIMHH